MDFDGGARKNVCLVSCNDTDIFPGNSRVFFSNKCPGTLHSKNPDEVLFVRMKAIGLAVDVAQQLQPGYVRVHLYEVGEQLEPSHGQQHFNRMLGGFTHPEPEFFYQEELLKQEQQLRQLKGEKREEDVRYPYTFKTFGYTPHLALRYSNIDKFQVLLTDAHNQRFRVERGPPTILFLEVLSESEVMDKGSFNVSCRSTQKEIYPNNTLHRFTVPLPEMFDLQNYEVTLLNVIYPPGLTEECITSMRVENEVYDINLHNIKDISTWVKTMNKDLKLGHYGRELRFVAHLVRDLVTGQRKRHISLVRLPKPPGEQQNNFLQVRLSWSLLRMLGQTDANLALLMLTVNQRVDFDSDPSLNNILPNPVALLMCDIVKPGIIGKHMRHLLGCVGVKHRWFDSPQINVDDSSNNNNNDNNDNSNNNNNNNKKDKKNMTLTTKMYEPAHLHYVDVKETPFSSISFEFINPTLDLSERAFRSVNPDDSITVTLAFRPKRIV